MLSNCKHQDDLVLYEYSLDAPKRIIDIGASDGVNGSNSRLFIDLGWDALLIEPQAEKYKELSVNANYNGGGNVVCINAAISAHDGETDFLFNRVVNDHSRIPNENYYSERFGDTPTELIKVDCMTLDTLFVLYPDFKDLGILSIDTEGYDEVILQELMKTDVRPHVIICEHHTEAVRKRQKAILTDYIQVRKISNNIIYKWIQ